MKLALTMLVALATAVALPVRGGAAISVPLTVTERAGVKRTGEIAAGGVPMPRGAVKDTESFGVVDETGKPVPAQFTVLGRWPSDRSIRWMLVEFPVTVAQGETRRFTLKDGIKNPKPERALRARETDEGVHIDLGGEWGVDVPKGGYGAADPGGGFVIETVSGDRYGTAADADGTVTLEAAGPLRVTVRFDGRHKDANGRTLLAYRVRTTHCAGMHGARIQYTFTHDQGPFNNDAVEIKSLILRFAGQSADEAADLKAVVGGAPKDHGAVLKAGQTLRQAFLSSDSYTVSGALTGTGKTRQAGTAQLGWCALTRGDETAACAVRWCSQLYPKAFTLRADGGLKIELVPPDAKEPVRIYRGMSKTHDMLIVGSESFDRARAAAMAFQQPLFIKCPTAWYCEGTLGFGRLLSVGSKHLKKEFASFDQRVAAGFVQQVEKIRDLRDKVVDRRRNVDSYGMVHFGDGFHHYTGSGHRALEWDNCYYSYTHMLAMQFARSGSDVIFDTLREAARYEGDVGIGWTALDRAGPRQNPGKYHIAGFGSFNNHISGSWNFYKPIGMMEAFYLTGDRRYEDAGLANFNWTLRADGYDIYHNPRSVGAGLRALVHGYLATGNKDFLAIARDVARKAVRFYRVHGHFAPVRNSIFMCPNALSGLCTYEELTGDPDLGKVLPDIVKAHFDRFGRRPGRTDYAYMNLYTARLAKNDELLKSVQSGMAEAGFGGIRSGNHAIKDFSASKRDVPLIFWQLSDYAADSVKPWGRVDLGPPRPDTATVPTITAPKLDGTIAKGEWDKAAVIDLVASPDVHRQPQAPTRLRVGHDNKNLYLAVTASEPRLDLLKTDVKEDGGPTYSDDSVEVFVGPNSRRFNVKLMVNAIGKRKTSLRGHYTSEFKRPAEDAFPVVAGRTKDAWVLEVVIPFEKIGVKDPKAGTEIAFNVIRWRQGRGPEKPGESSTWNGTSNQIESVGTLVLGK